jgi:hypothetical protein
MGCLRATGQEKIAAARDPFMAVFGVEGQPQQGRKTPFRKPIS